MMNQQPTATKVTIVEPSTTTVVVPPTAQGGCQCDCSVPPDASGSVRGARISTIISIVIHVIIFGALGFLVWSAYLSCLIAFIMGGIQLCMFQKCTYITAGILYLVGLVFDLITAAVFIAYGGAVLSIPSFLGVIIFIIASVFSFVASCNWATSGAPGAAPPAGPVVTQINPSYPTTSVNVSAAPPAYSANV